MEGDTQQVTEWGDRAFPSVAVLGPGGVGGLLAGLLARTG
jgi:hypothetical protein